MIVSASRAFVCDECGVAFAPLDGGACSRCRRTLCDRHLLGWFGAWRRLLGQAPVCVSCRTSAPGPTSSTRSTDA